MITKSFNETRLVGVGTVLATEVVRFTAYLPGVNVVFCKRHPTVLTLEDVLV